MSPVPASVQEIEITYQDGAAPRVALKADRPPGRPSSRRITGTFVDLLSLVELSHGNAACRAGHPARGRLSLWITTAADDACGDTLHFHGAAPLDLLSYDRLRIKGHTSRPTTIGFADDLAQPPSRWVPVAHVSGSFDVDLALTPVIQGLDARRVHRLVVVASQPETAVVIDQLVLVSSPSPPPPVLSASPAERVGFWLWNYHEALADPQRVVARCQAVGATRILVQMPAFGESDAVWHAYSHFLLTAQSAGLAALALDGFPEAIYEPGPLVAKIRRLLREVPNGTPIGIQLDLEPYLLPHFVDRDYALYLQTLDRLKQILPRHVRLSVVMPFWFTAIWVDGRPLAYAVMDRVDDVAVMTYRTDMEELHDLALDWLRYGKHVGTSVWLAVETRALPLERQIILIPETRPALADAYLDRSTQRLVLGPIPENHPAPLDTYRIAHRLTIRPERLTFAGRSRQEVRAAIGTIHRVFPSRPAGVLIHDYTGYFWLPE